MTALIRWIESRRKWRHCPHDNVRGIYGDAANHSPGQRRNRCLDCGNTLDGPANPRGTGAR